MQFYRNTYYIMPEILQLPYQIAFKNYYQNLSDKKANKNLQNGTKKRIPTTLDGIDQQSHFDFQVLSELNEILKKVPEPDFEYDFYNKDPITGIEDIVCKND